MLTAAEMNRVRQARYVWQWFLDAFADARDWSQSFTGKRDSMISGDATGAVPVPGGPVLPAAPTYIPLPSGTARRYAVEEPLPAPGVAEIWTFEVQYRYKNAPFGQISQPLQLTVRG